MKSKITQQFRVLYKTLPQKTQEAAVENYYLWKNNPKHPSLHFKPITPKRFHIWSVRVSLDYRALALVENETAKWFWIGTHKDYDKILRGLKAVRKNIA